MKTRPDNYRVTKTGQLQKLTTGGVVVRGVNFLRIEGADQLPARYLVCCARIGRTNGDGSFVTSCDSVHERWSLTACGTSRCFEQRIQDHYRIQRNRAENCAPSSAAAIKLAWETKSRMAPYFPFFSFASSARAPESIAAKP